MTKKELEQRIAALEAQVSLLSAQLAAKQQPVVIPAPAPYRPYWPPSPTITYSTSASLDPRARAIAKGVNRAASAAKRKAIR